MRLQLLLLTGLLPMLLSACSPVSLATSTASVGYAIADERSAGTIIDDAVIKAAILHHFTQKDIDNLLLGVAVTVNEGRVLLTGTVQQPHHAVQAVQEAWKADGVQEVINEIQVAEPLPLKQRAKDIFIAEHIASELLLTRQIRSVNYSVEVIGGVAYIMGIAQDPLELKNVTTIAARTRGVDKVVSHVRMRESTLRPVNANKHRVDWTVPISMP